MEMDLQRSSARSSLRSFVRLFGARRIFIPMRTEATAATVTALHPRPRSPVLRLSFLPSLSLSARLCSASICVRANVTLDHLFRCA